MKSGMNFSAKIQKVRTAVTKTSAPESGPGRPGSSEEVGLPYDIYSCPSSIW